MAIMIVEHALDTHCQRALFAEVLNDLVVVPTAHDLVLDIERHVLVLPQEVNDLLVDFELFRIDVGDLGLASDALLVLITQDFSYAVLTEGVSAVRQDQRLSLTLVEEFLAALACDDEVHFQ